MLSKFMNVANGLEKNAAIATLGNVMGAIDKLTAAASAYDIKTTHGLLCLLSEQSVNGNFFGTQSLKTFMESTPASDCPAYFNTDAPLLLYAHYVLDTKGKNTQMIGGAARIHAALHGGIDDLFDADVSNIDDFGTFLIKLKNGTIKDWYNNSALSFYVDLETYFKYVGQYNLMYNLPISEFAVYIELLQLAPYFETIRNMPDIGRQCYDIYKQRRNEIEAKLTAIDSTLMVTVRFISIFELNNSSII